MKICDNCSDCHKDDAKTLEEIKELDQKYVFFGDLVDEYKGFNIKKDPTVKQNRFYSVVNYKVLTGGSVDIVKRKIDRQIKELD